MDLTPKILNRKAISFKGNCTIGKRSWIEAIGDNTKNPVKILIGRNFSAGNELHIGSVNNVLIGNNVLLGSRVLISDHNHGIYNGDIQSLPTTPPLSRLLSKGMIDLGDNIWIGDNVCIIGKVSIGEGVVVGANSVVVSNIPPKSIVAGNPARVIKSWCDKKEKWIRV